jgi:hypothetical protein
MPMSLPSLAKPIALLNATLQGTNLTVVLPVGTILRGDINPTAEESARAVALAQRTVALAAVPPSTLG